MDFRHVRPYPATDDIRHIISNLEDKKTYYGFYLPTMEQIDGSLAYMSIDGKKVRVTVVNTIQQHNTKYNDMQYIGQVLYPINESKIPGLYTMLTFYRPPYVRHKPFTCEYN